MKYMVPFGVDTGCGAVGSPSNTRGSSVKFKDPLPLQVMVGPGTPVAVHSNTAVIPSLTVTFDSSGGSVIAGGTAQEKRLFQ